MQTIFVRGLDFLKSCNRPFSNEPYLLVAFPGSKKKRKKQLQLLNLST